MEFNEARDKFLKDWGELGTRWGINRTMAQIHALLLISPRPLSVAEIRQRLGISMGNANLNLHALMDWGLIYRRKLPGERKDFFEAEKDLWEVVKRIIHNRKERELKPVLHMLDEVSSVEGSGPEVEAFRKAVHELRLFGNKADAIMEAILKADANWVQHFLKMVR